MSEPLSSVDSLLNQIVVFDLTSPFVIIGTLSGDDVQYFVVDNADVHDLRDSPTTREFYVLETRRLGVRANRKRTYVLKSDVVSLSRLADVLE